MVTKFLDPKNDVAFKKIFGTEKNKDILIHFLNDMLSFKEHYPIVDVTFLKTVQDAETAAHKTSIVDISCRDEKGNCYIVEMQVAKTKGFEKRAQYYAAKAYGTQAHRGDEYTDLKEVIFLAIADYQMFPEKKAYKSDHIILDKETHEHDLQDFSFTFVELPKFNKTLEELSNDRERWCYFFRHAEETTLEDFEKIIEMNGVIKEAYKALDAFYWTEQELIDYEHSEKQRRDYLATLMQKFDEGEAKGRAEERVIAEQEKAEMQADFARTLWKKGWSLEEIAETIELQPEKVKRILDTIHCPE